MSEIKDTLDTSEETTAQEKPKSDLELPTDEVVANAQKDISENARKVSMPYADTPKAKILGEGVFATELIESREIIAIFEGELVDSDSFPKGEEINHHVFQIGSNQYIYAHEGIATNIQHSQNPNCGIREDNIVISIRDIEPGEALTLDYRSFQTKDGGENRTFENLSFEDRQRYAQEGIIPEWILKEWEDRGKHAGLEPIEEVAPAPKKTPTPVTKEKTPVFTTEGLKAPEIPDEVIREVTDLFRLTFANSSPKSDLWKEYVVCPPCDTQKEEGLRLSARDVHGRKITLEELDDPSLVPDCPCCHEKMMIFHDPKILFDALKEKLGHDGWLSILREESGEGEKGKLAGFTFGYKRPLKETFEKELGRNYLFAKVPEELNPPRSYDNFKRRLQGPVKEGLGIEVDDDTPMLVINCLVVADNARGLQNSYRLGEQLAAILPKEEFDTLSMGEAIVGNLAHKLFMSAGAVQVADVYTEKTEEDSSESEAPMPQKGEYVIVLVRIRQYAEKFRIK